MSQHQASGSCGEGTPPGATDSLSGYSREVVAPYREYASPTGLEDVVACLWENDRVRVESQLVVPDGCVDLVWFGSEGLKVVGADTGPHVVEPLGSSTAGIRLLPGAAGAVLGIPASEIRDQQVDLSLVWGSETGLTAEVMSTATPSHRLELLARGGIPAARRPRSADRRRGPGAGSTDSTGRAGCGGTGSQRTPASATDAGRGRLRPEDVGQGRPAPPADGPGRRGAGGPRGAGRLRQPGAHDRRGTSADGQHACPIPERRRAYRCLASVA